MLDFSTTFKDDKGRSWTVYITDGAIMRVKRLCNFSFDELLVIVDEKKLRSATKAEREQMAEDSIKPLRSFLDRESFDASAKFFEVLYALLQPDAEKIGIGQEDFYDAFSGQSGSDARDAFLQSFHDFFRLGSPKKMMIRGALEMRKRERVAEMTLAARAEKEIKILTDQMTEEKMIAMANAAMDRVVSMNSAAALPESVELTPAASP